jgi:hypothetical protein
MRVGNWKLRVSRKQRVSDMGKAVARCVIEHNAASGMRRAVLVVERDGVEIRRTKGVWENSTEEELVQRWERVLDELKEAMGERLTLRVMTEEEQLAYDVIHHGKAGKS